MQPENISRLWRFDTENMILMLNTKGGNDET